ncbi:hypothetical protein EW145_g1140 [Phellinidium pouzarii]|uniref:Mitochondrial outer membrane transport complex Sam37/metaxin N-terminal domain-containing protein n=1 Tax=Phellinidium pouzarii TaxID=167371 RepID=A0A4S4LHD3_9AGAM|nr:hypothetical protein EW145_g1140 [Phellinidium pouzarii]
MDNEPELVLHVWPGKWDLPTFTPDCLASVLYAQLSIPGKFVLEECTNPDLSPNGQFPYLTHGLACVASFPSIVKYIAGLHRSGRPEDDGNEERGQDDAELTDLSASLSPKEKAQQMAWMAFVSANLGDLVACSFYTLRHNYYEYTRPQLATLFPLPQRYYLPDRLREMHKPRLEAAGLWSIHAEEAEEEKRKKRGVANESAVAEAFGKEKVLEKARTTLNLLTNILREKPLFFHNQPTALDTLVAAHILLLTYPPLPNDLLRALVANSYPTLHAHARHLRAHALPAPLHAEMSLSSSSSASLSSSFDLADAHARPTGKLVPLRVRAARTANISQLASSFALPFHLRSSGFKKPTELILQEDVEFDRMRWVWYGLSFLGVVSWAWAVGRKLVVDRADNETAEEELVEGDDEVEEYEGDDSQS